MRLNRYAAKRRHKRKLKKNYAERFGRYAWPGLLEAEMRREAAEKADTYWYRKHPPRNGGFEYWGSYSVSGRRKFAKNQTNRVLRQAFRNETANREAEDIRAMRGADYRKNYDYNWTVW